MAVEIIMPKAGMAMEEGTVIEWLKKVGDKVEAGEPLLIIETDKTTMEIESPASGYLLKILYDSGDVVPVVQTIGYIGDMGEELPDKAVEDKEIPADNESAEEKTAKSESKDTKKLSIAGNRVAATPAARRIATEKGIDLSKITGTGRFGEIKAADVEKAEAVKATPLARRIAEDQNIDLSRIQGSGFNGKIRKEDLGLTVHQQEKAVADVLKTEPAVAERKPLKGMRKVIADRKLKSHTEIPPVTLNVKADVTELVALREKLNAALGFKVSINDFILRATALSLKESPNINVSLEDNELVFKSEVNVGMAVALDDGLIVPVLRNIDKMSLVQIAEKSKELAGKAREGKLLPDDYTGGTFTVSNLGMFDITAFTPIINLPEAAILGVCTIENELKMIDGKIENRSIMGLSLTFDHRLIDGAQAAVFLKKIKLLLQNPLKLIV
mgnify:CR=1 FL=1